MILGLTGAFGGGKSTVLRYFSNQNWFVFDADAVCHSLYDERDRDFYAALRNIFGVVIFSADGFADKKAIAEICFSSPGQLDKLTGIIYPVLQKKLDESIAFCRNSKINGVFELPLLYEGGYEKLFDAVLALWTSPEIRMARLKQRGFTAEDMRKRDSRQLAPEIKLERADFALINNGSEKSLYLQLDSLLKSPLFI